MPARCAQAISLLVQYMNRTPEVSEFIDGWESKLQFDLEGEDPFAVVFQGGKVSLVKSRLPDADVSILCDSRTFFDIMTGKASQDDAFANGIVQVEGSIIDSVRFRHAAEITQRKHGVLFSTLRALSRFT
jgi:putative sterol carrier protein